MSILEPSEEEIFNKPAIFEKEKVNLILSNVRLVIAKKKTIIKEMNYHLIEKIKYTKKDEPNPDEKTTSKFRILDAQENKIDITFKGVTSPEDLKKAVHILKQKKSEADSENQREQENSSASSDQKSSSDAKFDRYLYEKGDPPEDKILKAKILNQNPAALNLFKGLLQKQIATEDLFWVNFKLQMASQQSLTKYQQDGYSSRFLSEVVADSKSRGNQFSFTLDDSIKRQILRKKPRIAEKFISFMREKEKPSKKDENPMTPEEAENFFWQQYFAAQLRDSSYVKSKKDKDRSNIFDMIPIKDTVSFNENSRAKRARSLELSVRVGSLYEPINPIGNSSFGCGCGQGIFNKEHLPQLFQSTIDSYNIHSELSLIDNGILPDTTREIKDDDANNNDGNKRPLEMPLYMAPELDDLLTQKEPNLSSLKIKKAETDSQQPIAFGDEAKSFAAKICQFSDSFIKMPTPPQPPMKDAVIILRDMTGDQNNLYNYQKINSQRSPIYSGLEEVRNLKAQEQILLFLFWSNYLSQKPDQEKIEKLREEIDQLKQNIDRKKNMFMNDESKRALSPLYEEMSESLEKVLGLFDSRNNAQQVNELPANLDEFGFF